MLKRGWTDSVTYILNSGVALYFVNSSSHSACVIGGRTPATGFHSVMLNPDSVSLVTPPTTMTPNANMEHTISQRPTEGGDKTGSSADWSTAAWKVEFEEKKRGCNLRPAKDRTPFLTE